MFGFDGRTLDPVCRDPADAHHVSNQLLHWHFRQLVLANMRGVGESVFEHDFPPGTDMMAEIRNGPYSRERFELELSSRLRGCLKIRYKGFTYFIKSFLLKMRCIVREREFWLWNWGAKPTSLRTPHHERPWRHIKGLVTTHQSWTTIA